MGRSEVSGPFAGAYIYASGERLAVAASQSDVLVLHFTAPGPCRLVEAEFRNSGGAGLHVTAFKLRKLAGSAGVPADALVAASDTQLLSADGTTINVNTKAVVKPAGTPKFASSALRDLAKGDQVGLFMTTDGTVGNRDLRAKLALYMTGHVAAAPNEATGVVSD